MCVHLDLLDGALFDSHAVISVIRLLAPLSRNVCAPRPCANYRINRNLDLLDGALFDSHTVISVIRLLAPAE